MTMEPPLPPKPPAPADPALPALPRATTSVLVHAGPRSDEAQAMHATMLAVRVADTRPWCHGNHARAEPGAGALRKGVALCVVSGQFAHPLAKSGGDKKELGGDRLVSKNRRAFFDYEVSDTFEAGVVLLGSEVRALRAQGSDLSDAWVDIQRDEAWLKGMKIPVLAHAAFGHEEKRARKLLLHREQIERLRGAVEREGMTLIAVKCYFKNNRVKLEIALARGKKRHDKRQTIRERDAAREAEAAMRRGRR